MPHELYLHNALFYKASFSGLTVNNILLSVFSWKPKQFWTVSGSMSAQCQHQTESFHNSKTKTTYSSMLKFSLLYLQN